MGSVQFQVVPCFSLSFFSMFIGPRVLICCTCYFQSDFFFVYFGFLYLRVSSGSNKGVTYLGSLVHLCPGQGGTWQTNITGVCGPGSQCLGLTETRSQSGRLPHLHCSGSRLLCRGTVQSRPWVVCTSQV